MLKNLLALLLISTTALAQSNFTSYLPPNNHLDTLTRGDLNKDNIDDIVLVSESNDTNIETTTPRTLIILFGQPDGTYKLNTKTTTAVVGKNEYAYVFFSGITIKNNTLIIEHEYLRGGCTHIFRYQHNGFYLIGASSHTGDPDYFQSLEYNLSTGKYIAIYEREKKTITNGTQKLTTLPKIETYKLFDVEVHGESL